MNPNYYLALIYQDTPTHDAFEGDLFGDHVLNESSINLEEVPAPERVIIFTSVKLLGLLTHSRKGAVDGEDYL